MSDLLTFSFSHLLNPLFSYAWEEDQLYFYSSSIFEAVNLYYIVAGTEEFRIEKGAEGQMS